MAATRQLFDGFKHSVGGWAVLVWSELMTERLGLDQGDFELVERGRQACTFGEPDDTPFVMYNAPDRMARHMLEDHGPDVAMRMGEFCTPNEIRTVLR